MTAWEAIKIGSGKVGAGLWFLLKTWKWSINLVIIGLILLSNTMQGAETGEYWVAYRDGIIKQIIAADKVIYDNIQELESKNWALELQTDGKLGQSWNNFWIKWDAYQFIIVEAWFIFMLGYLIWWILSQSLIAPFSYENGKSTLGVILIMIVLYSITNFTYLTLQDAVSGKQILDAVWPPFPGIWSLLGNIGNIIQTL